MHRENHDSLLTHINMGRSCSRKHRKMILKVTSFYNLVLIVCILHSLTSLTNGESYEYDIDYMSDENYYDPSDQVAMAVASRPNQGLKYQQHKETLDEKLSKQKALEQTLYCPIVDCNHANAKILCPEHCNKDLSRYPINAAPTRNQKPNYQDRHVEPYKHLHQRQHPTTSPPTVFDHFFGDLLDKVKPSTFLSNPTKKYRSNFSKRRALIQNHRPKKPEPSRFVRPSNVYRPERYSNQNYRDSRLVDCRTNSQQDNLEFSKKFPYGHLRCCSIVRRNFRRNVG